MFAYLNGGDSLVNRPFILSNKSEKKEATLFPPNHFASLQFIRLFFFSFKVVCNSIFLSLNELRSSLFRISLPLPRPLTIFPTYHHRHQHLNIVQHDYMFGYNVHSPIVAAMLNFHH